jgi:hypothetical protein
MRFQLDWAPLADDCAEPADAGVPWGERPAAESDIVTSASEFA